MRRSRRAHRSLELPERFTAIRQAGRGADGVQWIPSLRKWLANRVRVLVPERLEQHGASTLRANRPVPGLEGRSAGAQIFGGIVSCSNRFEQLGSDALCEQHPRVVFQADHVSDRHLRGTLEKIERELWSQCERPALEIRRVARHVDRIFQGYELRRV